MGGEWALVSLTEWATRRLIIVIVGTAAVTGVGATAFGRYVIPAQPDGEAGNPAAPAPVVVSPPTGETPVVVPEPTEDAAEEAQPTEEGSPFGAPTRLNEFGIPVGYPRTEAGAISACGNYVAAYGKVQNREPSRVHEVFRSIALPSAAERLANLIIEIDRENNETLGIDSLNSPNLNFNTRAAGYAVDSYSPDKARITIWWAVGIGVYGSPDPQVAPRQGWGTDYCELEWNSGDWKLADAGDGPAGPQITERGAERFGHFVLVGADQ